MVSKKAIAGIIAGATLGVLGIYYGLGAFNEWRSLRKRAAWHDIPYEVYKEYDSLNANNYADDFHRYGIEPDTLEILLDEGYTPRKVVGFIENGRYINDISFRKMLNEAEESGVPILDLVEMTFNGIPFDYISQSYEAGVTDTDDIILAYRNMIDLPRFCESLISGLTVHDVLIQLESEDGISPELREQYFKILPDKNPEHMHFLHSRYITPELFDYVSSNGYQDNKALIEYFREAEINGSMIQQFKDADIGGWRARFALMHDIDITVIQEVKKRDYDFNQFRKLLDLGLNESQQLYCVRHSMTPETVQRAFEVYHAQQLLRLGDDITTMPDFSDK